MGELIVIFMVLVFAIGLGVVAKDVLEHAKKTSLTKHCEINIRVVRRICKQSFIHH